MAGEPEELGEHRDMGPLDMHAIVARDVAQLADLPALAQEWSARAHRVGLVAHVLEDSSFRALRSDGSWMPLGGAPSVRHVTQIATAYAEGITPHHIGLVGFSAGERLTAGSAAMIGTTGAPGRAFLELVSESSGQTICTWSTSDPLASSALAADVTFASAITCSLVLRGELAQSRAVLRGLDWRIV